MEGLGGVGLRDDDDDDEESEDESDSFSDEGVSVPEVAAGSSSRSRLRSRWSDGLCGWFSIWQRGGGNADAPCGDWE